jgi:hypothetical protein
MRTFNIYPSGSGIITDTGCDFWTAQPVPGYQAAVCAKSGMPPQVLMVDARQLALVN